MRWKKHTLARLKLPLILGLVTAAAGLVAIYYVEKITSGKAVLDNIKIDAKAALTLSRMHQTSSKNGIKEWTLEAASAKLLKEENLAVMEDVTLVFYLAGNQRVALTSKQGSLDTKQHDMTFSGEVTVTHTDYILTTDKLHYEKKRHILYSNGTVVIKGKNSTIEADSFHTDLNRKKAVLMGNVKGKFSETLDFFNTVNNPSF